MKKTLPLVMLLVLLSLSLSSCGTRNDETVATVSEEIEVNSEDTSDISQSEEASTEWVAAGEQTNLAPSDTPLAIAEGGLYLPYTPTALAQASGNIVLFFYASWSPASIATNKDITDKKDTLPKDLTIFRVSFDDADAMKQQYGVTDQQTFVQVTNTGELIKKWRGANTLEDIIQQIQK
jgi:Thioredoxin